MKDWFESIIRKLKNSRVQKMGIPLNAPHSHYREVQLSYILYICLSLANYVIWCGKLLSASRFVFCMPDKRKSWKLVQERNTGSYNQLKIIDRSYPIIHKLLFVHVYNVSTHSIKEILWMRYYHQYPLVTARNVCVNELQVIWLIVI